MFRLIIDCSLGAEESTAAELAGKILNIIQAGIGGDNYLKSSIYDATGEPIKMQYRLGNDEDRQKSNYLDINENGHVSNKKLQLTV